MINILKETDFRNQSLLLYSIFPETAFCLNEL